MVSFLSHDIECAAREVAPQERGEGGDLPKYKHYQRQNSSVIDCWAQAVQRCEEVHYCCRHRTQGRILRSGTSEPLAVLALIMRGERVHNITSAKILVAFEVRKGKRVVCGTLAGVVGVDLVQSSSR